jgi:hypothetical protein
MTALEKAEQALAAVNAQRLRAEAANLVLRSEMDSLDLLLQAAEVAVAAMKENPNAEIQETPTQ